MSGVAADIVAAVVVPGSVATGIAAVGTRWPSASRYAVPAAFAAAVVAGCWLVGTPWIPSRHWHWLPYVAILAAWTGAANRDDPVRSLGMVLLADAFLAGVTAWCLVPTWDSLQPPRRILVPGLAIALFLLIYLLQRLPRSVTDRSLLALMVFSSFVVAVGTAALVSISYAKLAMIATTALMGAGWPVWRTASVPAIRALYPSYATVVGGCALFGAIEPTPPLLPLAWIPWVPVLATLVLVPFASGSMAPRRGSRWLVAIVLMGMTAFALHRATQSTPPEGDTVIEDDAMYLDEDYFQ